MKAKRFLLVVLASGALTACSTVSERQMWDGAPAEVRERLGTVGVRIEYAQSRDFAFATPDPKGTAAGNSAGAGVTLNLYAASLLGNAAPLALVLLPAFAAGGAIYGSIAGVPEADLRAGLTAVTNALRSCDLTVHLPERVMEQARAHHFEVVDSRGGDAVGDTRLSIRIVTQQLAASGLETPDPKLFLHYVVEARVADTNGAALYNTFVEMVSSSRRFSEWAEHDARRLRKESQRMARKIAEKIVGRVFLGDASE